MKTGKFLVLSKKMEGKWNKKGVFFKRLRRKLDLTRKIKVVELAGLVYEFFNDEDYPQFWVFSIPQNWATLYQ